MDLFKIIESLKTTAYYAHYQTTGRAKEFAKKRRINHTVSYFIPKQKSDML